MGFKTKIRPADALLTHVSERRIAAGLAVVLAIGGVAASGSNGPRPAEARPSQLAPEQALAAPETTTTIIPPEAIAARRTIIPMLEDNGLMWVRDRVSAADELLVTADAQCAARFVIEAAGSDAEHAITVAGNRYGPTWAMTDAGEIAKDGMEDANVAHFEGQPAWGVAFPDAGQAAAWMHDQTRAVCDDWVKPSEAPIPAQR